MSQPNPKSFVVLIALVVVTPVLTAKEPHPDLSMQIDQEIQATHVGPMSSICTDSEFIRRCYLDLIGRIPSARELADFLRKEEPEKRIRLVDDLLKRDAFNEHMSVVLDVMLMERRVDSRVATSDWRAYLKKSLAASKPLNQIAREILSADPADPRMRPAAKFYLDRSVETHALTRDVSRMFFGRDVQCAQCHDHPIVGDYLQSEYYGIFSFLNRSFLSENADKKKSMISEKADGDVEFSSVFDPDAEKMKGQPHLVDGLALDAEPALATTMAYVVSPSKNSVGIPRFSRRQQLARLTTHTYNRAFARNFANRFWKHMMGQGLVEPVDFHHSDNLASHPRLLELLADEFVAANYNLRALLRAIALSKAYQRSIDFPQPDADENVVKQTISQLTRAIDEHEEEHAKLLAAVSKQNANVHLERKRLREIDSKLDNVAKQISDEEKTIQSAKKILEASRKKLAEKQKQLAAVEAAAKSAASAAQSVPNDTELLAVRDKLNARAAALKSNVEASQVKIEEQQKTTDVSNGNIKNARIKFAKLQSDRIVSADMVAEARGARRYVYSQFHDHQTTLSNLKQHLAEAQLSRDYHDSVMARNDGQEAIEVAKQRIASLDTAFKNRETELAGLNQEITGLAAGLKTAESPIVALEQKLAVQSQALENLAVAREHLVSAATQDDTQLSKLVSELDEQIDNRKECVDAVRKQVEKRREELSKQRSQLRLLQQKSQKIRSEKQSIEQQIVKAHENLSKAEDRLSELDASVQVAQSSLLDAWTRRFCVRSPRPLSPEQMAASVATALGLDERFRIEAVNEWKKKNKDKKPEAIPSEEKEEQIRVLFKNRMNQVESTFVSLFAAPPASPQDVFSSTVDQALFFANDGRMRNWLSPYEKSTLRLLVDTKDPGEVASIAYSRVLGRPPSAEEASQVTTYLNEQGLDRKAALQQLIWALITSLEFRFY